MGVLAGYFTADSDQFARRALPAGPGAVGLPYVDCKGWLDTPAAELSGRDLSESSRCFGSGHASTSGSTVRTRAVTRSRSA